MSNNNPEPRRNWTGVTTGVMMAAIGAWGLFEVYRHDSWPRAILFAVGAVGVLFILSGVRKAVDDARSAPRDEKGAVLPVGHDAPVKKGFDHDAEGLG